MATEAKTPSKTNPATEPANEPANEPSLKGTFASVMLLGGFILASWLGAFILFMVKN
jgi:hypothetical protein